ncbi:MAG: prepilin-type N-terminal cleavage/methylation domain-containing protein [Gallionella sp.]|jgi:prepilin-type N-terminal cleavage/methylation domain-containing protein
MRAFSLIELSIVLVILGLLTGGILAGKSLIHAAELRSLLSDRTRYITVAHTFRDKYFFLPGDIPNATSFWDAADNGDGSGLDCIDAQGTNYPSNTRSTCNGNGNGQVSIHVLQDSFYYANWGGYYPNWQSIEPLTFWQHLADAGMIEGTFVGTTMPSDGSNVPGKNLPVTKYKDATFNIGWMGNYEGDTSLFAGDYGNTMQMGRSPDYIQSMFLPEEAWNMDVKTDDGVPGTGRTIGYKGRVTPRSSTPCTTAYNQPPGSDGGATYNLSDTTASCYLFFVRAF